MVLLTSEVKLLMTIRFLPTVGHHFRKISAQNVFFDPPVESGEPELQFETPHCWANLCWVEERLAKKLRLQVGS